MHQEPVDEAVYVDVLFIAVQGGYCGVSLAHIVVDEVEVLLRPLVVSLWVLLGVGAFYLDVHSAAGGQIEVIPAFLIGGWVCAAYLKKVSGLDIREAVVYRNPRCLDFKLLAERVYALIYPVHIDVHRDSVRHETEAPEGTRHFKCGGVPQQRFVGVIRKEHPALRLGHSKQ